MYENWYVVQVKRGQEESTAAKCRQFISEDILEECFVPKYKSMKRFHGKWHHMEQVLFPGYVFMITDHVDDLFTKLKQVPDFTMLLGNDGEAIYPIYKEEVLFLLKYDTKDHNLDMSQGYIVGDKMTIVSGPLIGHEGLIKKIDRHKRLAFLEVEMLGQISVIKVGLEIISKT